MTDLAVVEKFAWQKMKEHGLFDEDVPWSFGWTNAKLQFGVCRYRTKTIYLSKPLTLLNTDEHVFDTVLHEIAHAIVGPGNGHGNLWKSVAWGIGARPERCAADDAVTPPAKWLGVCEEGCEIPRHRLSKRIKVGGARCAPHNLGIEWTTGLVPAE